MQDIAKKVTLNKLGVEKDWVIEQIKKAGDEPVEVAAFAGVISDVKAKKSDLGDYILFEGDFMGINQITGQSLRSSAMILPSVAETPLMGMFKRATKTDGEGNIISQGVVEFAFGVTVRKDKAAIGYAYGVRNHNDNPKSDPIFRLLKLVPLSKVAVAALPASTEDEAPAVTGTGKGAKK